jgi:hypothetical protein
MSFTEPGVIGRKPHAAVSAIDPEELIPADETARILHQEPTTLTGWRHEGRGPPWIKIGRKCFYRRADIHGWLAQQRRIPRGGESAR